MHVQDRVRDSKFDRQVIQLSLLGKGQVFGMEAAVKGQTSHNT